MSSSCFVRPFLVVGACIVVVGAVGVVVVLRPSNEAPTPNAFSIPDPDLSGVEPQVSLKVGDTRRAVQRQPSSAEAWGRLGMVLDVHELFVDAMYCYERAAELDPNEFRWPYLLGLEAVEERPHESLSAFERAVQLDPDYLPARVRLAQQLSQENRVEDARKHYQVVLEADPKSFHAHLWLGQLLLGEGELAASEEHLSRAAALVPTAREVHSALSRLFARLGDLAAAEHQMSLGRRYPQAPSLPDPVYEQVESEGVSARWYNMRGIELMQRGQRQEAVVQFRQAAEYRSDVATFRGNYANTLMVLGQLDEAVREYRKALGVDPSSTRIRNNLAAALVTQGKMSEADELLQETLRRWPTDAETHHNLGVVYQKQGRLDDAMEQLELAIAAQPNYAVALRTFGEVLVEADRVDEAIASFTRSKDADPTELRTYQLLSNLLIQRGEFAAAAGILRAGLAVAASNPALAPTLAMELAWLLASCPDAAVRNGAEALRVVQIVVDAAPTNPMVLNVLAAAQAEAGDFDAAVRTTQHALSVAQSAGAQKLAQLIRSRLSLYQSGMPYRQSTSGGD